MTAEETAVELAVIDHIIDMIKRGMSVEFIKDVLERRRDEIEKSI